MSRNKDSQSEKNKRGTSRADRSGNQLGSLDLLDFVPKPPKTLDRHGKAYWREVCEQLLKVDRLSVIAVNDIEILCYNWQIWVKMAEKLSTYDSPIVTYSNGNPGARPELRVQQDAKKVMDKIQKDYGLTPHSNKDIPAPEREQEEDEFGI